MLSKSLSAWAAHGLLENMVKPFQLTQISSTIRIKIQLYGDHGGSSSASVIVLQVSLEFIWGYKNQKKLASG